MKRQMEMIDMVLDICRRDLPFEHFEEVSGFFKKLINDGKQLNYTAYHSDAYQERKAAIETAVQDRARKEMT
jgi:V/A-type H+-transporting ATPase subunit A